MDDFEKAQEKLMADAQTIAEDTHLNEWYEKLKEDANIIDNRSEFYN
jgi:hypothetical protein